jgi:hypothetical protein
MREKLPGRVCAGVLRGKVQIQVLNDGRVADTLGPTLSTAVPEAPFNSGSARSLMVCTSRR